jgi:glycine C-acetyltransferase
VGDEKQAMDFGEYLLKNGVFAQPIRYPTIPKGKARVRISVTSWLSPKEIEIALIVFDQAFKKFMN